MTEKNGKRVATDDDQRLYSASPRGIGSNWGPCMVCGGDPNALRNDCAMFVPSRETGDAIVALFKQGAKLDYRHFEPNWCQVKVTACDEHRRNLTNLVMAINATKDRLDGPGISKEMVATFVCEPVAA